MLLIKTVNVKTDSDFIPVTVEIYVNACSEI